LRSVLYKKADYILAPYQVARKSRFSRTALISRWGGKPKSCRPYTQHRAAKTAGWSSRPGRSGGRTLPGLDYGNNWPL